MAIFRSILFLIYRPFDGDGSERIELIDVATLPP